MTSKRREFSKAIKVAVIKRATRDGVIYCESCPSIAKKFQIDHVRPDGLLGEPTLDNAMLICEACWKIKNPQDTKTIAKAKAREASHLGVKPDAKQKIQQRPKKPDKGPKECGGRIPSKVDTSRPANLSRRFQ